MHGSLVVDHLVQVKVCRLTGLWYDVIIVNIFIWVSSPHEFLSHRDISIFLVKYSAYSPWVDVQCIVSAWEDTIRTSHMRKKNPYCHWELLSDVYQNFVPHSIPIFVFSLGQRMVISAAKNPERLLLYFLATHFLFLDFLANHLLFLYFLADHPLFLHYLADHPLFLDFLANRFLFFSFCRLQQAYCEYSIFCPYFWSSERMRRGILKQNGARNWDLWLTWYNGDQLSVPTWLLLGRPLSRM